MSHALSAGRDAPAVHVIGDAGARRRDEFGWSWQLVVFAVTLFFFSNVAVRGFLYGGWPIQPVAIFGAVVAALSVFIYARSGLAFLASPIAYWCAAFVAISVSSFIAFGGDGLLPILLKCYAVVFLLFFFAFFSMHPNAVRAGRVALACGVILAGVCNVYEVMNPAAFLPAGVFYGRSAGFYINPNQAGAAIVLGTVLAIGIVPRSLHWLFLGVSLGAILLTLSRAAVVLWCIAVAVLLLQRVTNVRTVVLGIGSLGATGYAAWTLMSDYLLRNRGINLELLQERVGFFATVGAAADYSQRERAAVAESAWFLFEDHPFFGAGIGSTDAWSLPASTHNMYLYFMADHGLIGALIYPALVFLSVRGKNLAARPYAITFACFALAWGLFSHNIVSELYSLISFGLMAAWIRATPPLDAGNSTAPV